MKARVGEVELYYEVDGQGPAIVLGHSIGQTAEIWRRVAERLADRYTVVRYDARGHGRSDKPPGPYRVEQMAEDVYGLLRVLGLERPVVGGLSLGGSITMALALAHPEAARALILVDTADYYEPDPLPRWEARAQAALSHGFSQPPQEQLDKWLTPATQREHPELMEHVVRTYLANDPTGYAAAGRALGVFDVRAELRRIDAPTLVIVGAEDDTTSVATARRIQRNIAGAELVVIPNAAHLAPWERPDAVAQAMETFLERVLAGTAG
jgi:3-oxoadipate enol-lactonase